MKLLTDLLYKSVINDFCFMHTASVHGTLEIYEFDGDGEFKQITEGTLKNNWREETPEEALKRMHQELDDYVEFHSHDNSPEEQNTEHAQATITENKRGKTMYEMKHDEVGVKEDDFL